MDLQLSLTAAGTVEVLRPVTVANKAIAYEQDTGPPVDLVVMLRRLLI